MEQRLIDANAFFERIGQIKPKNKQQYEDIGLFMNMITNAPTIPQTIITEFKGCDNCELERPQGEWIYKGTETGALGIQYEIKQCNKCGFEHSLCIPKNFCPNCGADMRGKEE